MGLLGEKNDNAKSYFFIQLQLQIRFHISDHL